MFFKRNYETIDATQLKDLLAKKINLIDVRETYEFQSGSIKGSKNIPMVGIMNNADSFLKKDETYYIICLSGSRSSRVCQILSAKGYKVINVKGGTGYFGMMYNEHIA